MTAIPPHLVEAANELLAYGRSMQREMSRYEFGIQELLTKLRILRDEISLEDDYNPIEHLSHRVKSPQSILEKLQRRGLEPGLEGVKQLDDIAGIRVTCSFIPDTYRLHEMLDAQPDITTLHLKDYIAEPKPNGYRGLHAIVETPVNLSSGQVPVKVEIQYRTIAMDFWASLEHKIYYKYDKAVPERLLSELTAAATTANQLDQRMKAIHQEVRGGS
ncbi:GTP pyrophosphokinase [Demetria terragena]|uniref:GTP pyrophosphokinase n=1 Tax=Demetria terragena TaxID=63959 RepID=UPI00037D0CCB|nr:GTP pyrophosphokinase family protein [Demetria terragena]